jgi:fructokinase
MNVAAETSRERAATVVVVGEALVDVVSSGGQVNAYPGGSPANVAVGLARLDLTVGLLTRLGRDTYGELIAGHLRRNKVRLINPPDSAATSVAQVSIDAGGAATYTFGINWDLAGTADDALEAALCVHTGSIAATLAPGARTVHGLIQRAQPAATISYDPNCRPSLMGEPAQARRQAEALVALSDIVKASDEDLGWLYPGQDHHAVAAAWLALGPSMIVITRGADGAWGLARAGTAQIPVPPTTVADTVGAGDSFMAAMLAGLARRDLLGAHRRPALRAIQAGVLGELLAAAAAAAAVTCSRPGADPPTADELSLTAGAGRAAARASALEWGTRHA